jgi:hypothetical protein
LELLFLLSPSLAFEGFSHTNLKGLQTNISIVFMFYW